MCGIAGFFRSAAPAASEATLRQMGDALFHRGPDAGGEYLDNIVGLAHRRLSIIDLSPQGNQPMFSADGRLVIVFNGEIYNFRELRQELEGQGAVFHSGTDTEVLLELYRKYGASCLPLLNGMFVFAIWDKVERTLFLARDRIGKKPLYYYHGGGDRLAFASEIKSLLRLPGICREIEPTAIVDFLAYQYIPDPKTIYRNIHKLPPAHYLLLKTGGEPHLHEYWDVSFEPREAGLIDAAEEELLALLQDATAIRLQADVPLGAFLSGGVDSSAVVALMAQVSAESVKTCTIGFDDKKHDESVFGREIAHLFSTEHSEYLVQERLTDTVKLLPKFFDEPFADSSALPTWHLAHLTRQGVTVALAGDGGDENFAGYEKYAVELKEHFARQFIPRQLLSLIHSATSGLEMHTLARKARSLTGSALLEPGRAFFRSNSCMDDDLLRSLLSAGIGCTCKSYDPAGHTLRYWEKAGNNDHVASMLYTDLKTYLPGDILVKVDRMSMANSLEVRAPFLDYRIVEFAASLPSSWKISGNSKKIILRKAFARLLPKEILNRPKHGFTVPLDDWFRGELKGVAGQSLLRQDSLYVYLNQTTVKRLWEEHQTGRRNHGTVLWSLLMLAMWQQEWQPS